MIPGSPYSHGTAEGGAECQPVPLSVSWTASRFCEDTVPMTEDLGMELLSSGLVEEMAAAAKKHGVMITVTVLPYEEDAVDEQ